MNEMALTWNKSCRVPKISSYNSTLRIGNEAASTLSHPNMTNDFPVPRASDASRSKLTPNHQMRLFNRNQRTNAWREKSIPVE